jgi:hypothetical protein
MQALVPERTGVFVIRVWAEGEAPRRLRARITETLDVMDRERTSTSAATLDEIEERVHEWLETFRASIAEAP